MGRPGSYHFNVVVGFRIFVSFIFGLALAFPSRLDHLLRARPPLRLQVQERGDQLFIAWNPDAVPQDPAGTLEVSDSSARQTWPISAGVHSVTYVYTADETNVYLHLDGESEVDIVRGVYAEDSGSATRVHSEAEKFASDLGDVRLLRASIRQENKRLDLLQQRALLLLNSVSRTIR
jgi:hypothetical protein